MKRVQVLVHWDRDALSTEGAAQDLYDAIAASAHPTIGDATASYIGLMLPEPVDVGSTEDGAFERVLWLDIYYEED